MPSLLRPKLDELRQQERQLTQQLGELDAERERLVQLRVAVRDEARELQAYLDTRGGRVP